MLSARAATGKSCAVPEAHAEWRRGGGQVMQPVCEWAASHPGTRVLLLPSTRDAMAAPVFPTPPLTRPGYAPSNVTMLPNPAVFTLDEVPMPDFLR